MAPAASRTLYRHYYTCLPPGNFAPKGSKEKSQVPSRTRPHARARTRPRSRPARHEAEVITRFRGGGSTARRVRAPADPPACRPASAPSSRRPAPAAHSAAAPRLPTAPVRPAPHSQATRPCSPPPGRPASSSRASSPSGEWVTPPPTSSAHRRPYRAGRRRSP